MKTKAKHQDTEFVMGVHDHITPEEIFGKQPSDQKSGLKLQLKKGFEYTSPNGRQGVRFEDGENTVVVTDEGGGPLNACVLVKEPQPAPWPIPFLYGSVAGMTVGLGLSFLIIYIGLWPRGQNDEKQD